MKATIQTFSTHSSFSCSRFVS